MIRTLHNPKQIEKLLRQHTDLHLYELGDLDDFFWDYTTWYTDPQTNELALMYLGARPPVLLALTPNPLGMRTLLLNLLPLLPVSFYAHLSPTLENVFSSTHTLADHGLHYKMSLTDFSRLEHINTTAVNPLTHADLDDLKILYQESYPENWFDERMLDTGLFVGLRRTQKLISVAGIHVYSPTYRVAALGSITTHPAFRGQGLATQTIAGLCQRLRPQVNHIGLNVLVNNKSALHCYTKLGFRQIGTYHEWQIDKVIS